MHLRSRHLLPLLAAVSVGLATPAVAAPPGGHGWQAGPIAIGLTTDQKLVKFNVDRSYSLQKIGRISGLEGDTRIVGIDYRVQDGLLYGVGEEGGIYTFDGDAVGTKVSQLTVELEGTNFGVDFNPVADRLRIVSDASQNLRHNLNDHTTTEDTALTYPATPDVVPSVSAIAYTNNDLDPSTGTTLYDLDPALDLGSIQSPANDGFLVPIGQLGVDAGEDAGFDIYSTIVNGVSAAATGYATLSVDDDYGIYLVSLATGAVTLIGDFPGWAQVSDIAVQINT